MKKTLTYLLFAFGCVHTYAQCDKVTIPFNRVRFHDRIKEEQLKASQEIRSEVYQNPDGSGNIVPTPIEDHLMTPYGPPDKNVRIK